MDMPADEGVDLIQHARKADAEDFVRARWIAGFQSVSLDEFKAAIGYAPQGGRGRFLSVREIEDDVRNILAVKGGEQP